MPNLRLILPLYFATSQVEDFRANYDEYLSQQNEARSTYINEDSVYSRIHALRSWTHNNEDGPDIHWKQFHHSRRKARRLAAWIFNTTYLAICAAEEKKRISQARQQRPTRPIPASDLLCKVSDALAEIEDLLVSPSQDAEFSARSKASLACRALRESKSPEILLYLFTIPRSISWRLSEFKTPGSMSRRALKFYHRQMMPSWDAHRHLRTLASLAESSLERSYWDGRLHREEHPDAALALRRIEQILYLMDTIHRLDLKDKNKSKDDRRLLALVCNIARTSGMQDLSEESLRTLASSLENPQDKNVKLKITPYHLEYVCVNLAKWNIRSLPWNTMSRVACPDCATLDFDSLAGGVKTCVVGLSTSRASQDTAPDYLCKIGVFLYTNIVAITNRRLTADDWGEMEPSGKGELELQLSNITGPWDGLAKLLQIHGFPHCDISNNTLDLAAVPGSPASNKIHKRVLSPLSSHNTVFIIEEWLNNCDACHDECSRWIGKDQSTVNDLPPYLPTRVVDLGTTAESTPRLFISNGSRAKYVALSYCWGGAPTFTTTLKTLSQMAKSIPVSKLPAVFIDAFSIARSLGIRYLWLDALCIVQDDKQDWDIEARKMGGIYQSAHVTIAATRSGCVSDSFLPKDNRRSQQVLDIAYKLDSPESGNMALVSGSPNPTEYVKDARLNSRGWVLQERLLSRRILHFARDQIYWECRQAVQAEDGSSFPLQDFDRDFLFPLPGLMKKINIKTLDEYSPERDDIFQKAWLSILAFYCDRGFTKASDRMVALLGLVNKLRPLTKRTYLDGNWFLPGSQSIPRSLLWRPENSRRSAEKSIPSWSWASRTGKLDFSFHNKDRRIEFNLLGLEAAIGDTPSALRIRGHTFSARAQPPVGNKSRSCDLFEVGSTENNEEPDIGNIYFDDLDMVQPGVVECLHLFDDVAGYPVYWAMRATSSGTKGPLYVRIGVATQVRGVRSKLVEKHLLLI